MDAHGTTHGTHGPAAHRALGSYLCGNFMECAQLGLSATVLFVIIVGVAPHWAIVIGIFTGATNVVP